jgi:guanylate kinase
MISDRQDAKTSSGTGPGKASRRGLLIVLSSPSGGGKTTIARLLLKRDKNIVRSVSCTTRKPRSGEKNGQDYFFVTRARFKTMVAQKKFLEWAWVHKNFYGTPRYWVEGQLKKGRDVLFVIDVQGGKSIKREESGALLIFLKPPSLTVLKKRLLGRGSEDEAALKVRLRDAKWELAKGRHYDAQVVNDRLPKAVADVAKIVQKERKKLNREVAENVK